MFNVGRRSSPEINYLSGVSMFNVGRRSSPEVACWTSDHWVGGSRPLGHMVHN